MAVQETGTESFWGEVNPWEHLVQLYETEGVFMDTLEGFLVGGLRAGDSAIAIGTPAHLQALEHRMDAAGLDVVRLKARDRYIALDAEATLACFMRDGWPDEQEFFMTIRRLLRRARSGEWRVRAFGEMVALLWERGHHAATVRLEQLWHTLCADEGLSLLCAYPKAGFTQHPARSVQEICAAHTRVLPH